MLADRMGCLKRRVVANKVVRPLHYVRFAAHHGVPARLLWANDAQSGGIVESLVGCARLYLSSRRHRSVTSVTFPALMRYTCVCSP
ncbi:hypothetical protein GCM10009744_36790 [Kribbella alba]|uniref:Uncharacterized protein n=1 Tax=Kribbella alba TaxID=190197 RepID=A0ABN2FEF1_9ACTN